MPPNMRLGKGKRSMREVIQEAVEMYNRYRAPESKAIVERVEGDTVVVRFVGPFCETCGINDWVEDFKYTLEDAGAEAELVEILEPEDFTEEWLEWRIGVFKIKRIGEPRRIEEELGLEED